MSKCQRLLIISGELKYGTDESTFTRVLVTNSYQQLHAVNEAYEQLAGKSLEAACEAELSGNMLKAAKTIRKFRLKSRNYLNLVFSIILILNVNLFFECINENLKRQIRRRRGYLSFVSNNQACHRTK